MTDQATTTSQRPVIVVNHESRINQYAVSETIKRPDGSTGVENRLLVLKPGANRVPADQWKLYGKEVKGELASGRLSIMDKPLRSMNERDAIELVQKTIDKPLLNAFKASESRSKVSEAIERHLAKVEGREPLNPTKVEIENEDLSAL